MMFAEQDAGLEELSKIISRQKNIARTIGDEVDTQNGMSEYHYTSLDPVSKNYNHVNVVIFSEILDDLADGIDRTTVGLINETRQVRTIARKDSTCGKKYFISTFWDFLITMYLFVKVGFSFILFIFRLLGGHHIAIYCNHSNCCPVIWLKSHLSYCCVHIPKAFLLMKIWISLAEGMLRYKCINHMSQMCLNICEDSCVGNIVLRF